MFDSSAQPTGQRWGTQLQGLEKVKTLFRTAIPDLKEVRDSLAHLDERMRKKATQVPITYDIESDNWEVGNLGGGRDYRILIVDWKKKDKAKRTVPGHSGSIPITRDTVEAVRVALQDAIDQFQWDGLRRYEPR